MLRDTNCIGKFGSQRNLAGELACDTCKYRHECESETLRKENLKNIFDKIEEKEGDAA
jgi:uncharacterized Fe-S cluster-containing MiaB family protein